MDSFTHIEKVWGEKSMCKKFKNNLENYHEAVIYSILIYLANSNWMTTIVLAPEVQRQMTGSLPWGTRVVGWKTDIWTGDCSQVWVDESMECYRGMCGVFGMASQMRQSCAFPPVLGTWAPCKRRAWEEIRNFFVCLFWWRNAICKENTNVWVILFMILFYRYMANIWFWFFFSELPRSKLFLNSFVFPLLLFWNSELS